MARYLRGWKAIAAFLDVSVRQARRFASKYRRDEERLPVQRDGLGTQRIHVRADIAALEEWERRSRPVATNDN